MYGNKWQRDYGGSRNNRAFNWQPFMLVELLPEAEQAPPAVTEQDVDGDMSWVEEQLDDILKENGWTPEDQRALEEKQRLEEENVNKDNYVPKGFTTKGARLFQADVIMSENYNTSSQISSYPVDKDGKISDHSTVKQKKITITAAHSMNALSYLDIDTNILNSPLVRGLEEFTSNVGSDFNQEEPVASRITYIYNLLEEWQRTGQPLVVKTKFNQTGIKDDENKYVPYTISNLSVPRNKDLGDIIKVNFTLTEFKTVRLGQSTVVTYDTKTGKKNQRRGKTKKPVKPKGKPSKKKELKNKRWKDKLDRQQKGGSK